MKSIVKSTISVGTVNTTVAEAAVSGSCIRSAMIATAYAALICLSVGCILFFSVGWVGLLVG